MLIPIFLTLLSPMAMSVLWISSLYQQETDWQKKQILLDNTAIRLGRNDVILANQIQKKEQTLRLLHQKLHQSLACSVVPATSVLCSNTARVLRMSLKSLVLASEINAKSMWRRATALSKSDLEKAGGNLVLKREAELKLIQKKCALCTEVTGWESSFLRTQKSFLSENSSRALRVAVSLEQHLDKKWTYRLWPQ